MADFCVRNQINMARIQIPNKTKEFVRWSQKDTCLLCSFPLVIYCHFHHVISVKDYGPEDEFNLIGLCGNHHGMIENLRRTESPSLDKLGSNDPNVKKWAHKIDAAMKMLDNLNPEGRKLVNLFLAPYPNSSNEKISNMFHNKAPHINVGIARMLIDKNVRLYKDVNQNRPRVYFQKPLLKKVISGFDPYDLMLLKETKYQDLIDSIVNSARHKVSDDIFDFSIAQQFIKLGFNYFFDDKDNLSFVFSDHLTFTIKQLREMSDDEYFDLERNKL